MHHLLAGVGRCDITPAPGAPQEDGARRPATSAAQGRRSAALTQPRWFLADSAQSYRHHIDVDSIGFDGERWTAKIIDAVVERCARFPASTIRFSCTRTHSGPNTFRMALITEASLDMATAYLNNLPQQIASAVWQAQQNLKPVRVARRREGTCEIGVNRRLRLENGQVVIGRN